MIIEIIETNEKLSESAWYDRHPTVSFEQPLTDSVLAPFGARLHTPVPDVVALKLKAIEAIEKWRDEQEALGIVFEHHDQLWDGGLIVRQRMQPVIALSELPPGFFWTSLSNEDVLMDLDGMRSLNASHEAALVARGFQIHARQRAMKASVAAMDAERLAAFVPDWE